MFRPTDTESEWWFRVLAGVMPTLPFRSFGMLAQSMRTSGRDSCSNSPDERFTIHRLRSWLLLHDNQTQSIVARYEFGGDIKKAVSEWPFLAVSTKTDAIEMIAIQNCPAGVAATIPVRLWRFAAEGPGSWDKEITALCPWCTRRHTVLPEVLTKLRLIVPLAKSLPAITQRKPGTVCGRSMPHLFRHAPIQPDTVTGAPVLY